VLEEMKEKEREKERKNEDNCLKMLLCILLNFLSYISRIEI
jgi:hypothetical protein